MNILCIYLTELVNKDIRNPAYQQPISSLLTYLASYLNELNRLSHTMINWLLCRSLVVTKMLHVALALFLVNVFSHHSSGTYGMEMRTVAMYS